MTKSRRTGIPPPLSRAIPLVWVIEPERWWSSEFRRLAQPFEFRVEDRISLEDANRQELQTVHAVVAVLPSEESQILEVVTQLVEKQLMPRTIFNPSTEVEMARISLESARLLEFIPHSQGWKRDDFQPQVIDSLPK